MSSPDTTKDIKQKLEEELAETRARIAEETEKKEGLQKESLKEAIAGGMSDQELIDFGYTKHDIEAIRTPAPTTPDEIPEEPKAPVTEATPTSTEEALTAEEQATLERITAAITKRDQERAETLKTLEELRKKLQDIEESEKKIADTHTEIEASFAPIQEKSKDEEMTHSEQEEVSLSKMMEYYNEMDKQKWLRDIFPSLSFKKIFKKMWFSLWQRGRLWKQYEDHRKKELDKLHNKSS